MQTRALFVLVWDIANEQADFHEWKNKKYKNEKLLYWLEYATCFGQGSPILVLQNKVDTAAERPKGILKKAKEEYKKDYPILDFLQVSAKTPWGFKSLEKSLQKHFRENKELRQHLQQELPTSWLDIRAQVLQLYEAGTKTLLVTDFEALCQQEEVLKSTSTILQYLHDTGVLYYQKRYFDNRIILNQGWAIEAIYKILDRESDYAEVLLQQEGRLDYEDLCSIWEGNRDDERKLFMDFMVSTELCFEVTERKEGKHPTFEERSFVVPAFLPPHKTEEVLYWEGVRNMEAFEAQISYRFLPSVFVQRFIVKAHRFSKVELMWQKGILLEAEEGFALVEADYGRKEILIRATDSRLVAKIKEELDMIAHEGKIKAQVSRGEEDVLRHNEKFMKGLAGLQKKRIVSENNLNNLKTMIITYSHILETLADGRIGKAIEDALKLVNQIPNGDYVNDLINLSGRNKRNERSLSRGTVDRPGYNLVSAQVSHSLQSVLKDMKKDYPNLSVEVTDDSPTSHTVNTSHITGDGNVTIQGSHFSDNSQININTSSDKKEPEQPRKQKILFLAANPSDEARLQTDLEYRLVSERMRDNIYYELLRPEFALTVENLIIAMNQKPQVIHFAGHGEQSGIIITNNQNQAQGMGIRPLKRLFRQHKESSRLILLNSCYSEGQAEALSSLGMYVIGMNSSVGDNAAINFASGLYIGLSQGKDVEKAYDDAMIVIETKHPSFADLPKVWKDGKLLDL